MRFLICLVLACLVISTASFSAEPLVGFVNHFPWIDKGMDQVAASGSNAVIFRAVSGLQKKDGSFDFSSIDRQIAFAEKNNLKVILLFEANPIYSPKEITDKCRAAGELDDNALGQPGTMPAMSSKIFNDWRDGYVKSIIDHVKVRDTKHVVIGYQPGAEWWSDAPARFNPAEIAAFRKWLAAKYGDISKLNKTWQSDYKSFDEAEPTRAAMESFAGGTGNLAAIARCSDLGHDMSWDTHEDLPITPGKDYTFRVRCRMNDIKGEGVYLSIAWRKNGQAAPVLVNNSPNYRGTRGWQEIEFTAKAPESATKAWILLKLHGGGRVDFDDVFFGEKGSNKNLAPNSGFSAGKDTPDFYFFDNWTGGEQPKSEYVTEDGNRYVSIQVDPSKGKERFNNASAAAYDWFMFSYAYFSDYIDGFCKAVKDLDPSRLTVGYLTYSFGFAVEWDYVQQEAIALDVLLPRLKHLDILGLQICSAEGDPVRITAAIDIARKYGKRVFPIDLIDFTSGVALGYPKMDAVTECAAQHGATGAFYYCWYGTPDYNYYTGMPVPELNKMLTTARASMSEILDKKLETRVAVIQPILPSIAGDPNNTKNDWKDFVGLYKAVLDLQFCPDIWTLTELTEQKPDLKSKYDVVFLPDCAYAQQDAADVLAKFEKAGGKIVKSGRSIAFDEAANPILGAKAYSNPQYFGKEYLGLVFRTTHAGNTPPLFIETERQDSLNKRRTGMLSELSNKLDKLGIERPVRINQPGVGCAVYTKEGEKLFFITNRSSLKELKGISINPGTEYKLKGIAGGEIIKRINTASGVTLDLKLDSTACIISFAKHD